MKLIKKSPNATPLVRYDLARLSGDVLTFARTHFARAERVVALNCLVRSYRPATASLLSATPKKNVPCISDLAGVKFFLKVERTFFFGVLPSKYSGRWRNNADEVLAKLFFGERICQNFGSFVFEFGCRKWKRRGLGRNFPFAPLFVLGEFGADNTKKLPKDSFTKLFKLCIIVVSRNYAIYSILYTIMLNNNESNVK